MKSLPGSLALSLALPLVALTITACDKPANESAGCGGCGSCSTDQPAADAASVKIFNGENLDGWSALLVDKSLTKEDVWSVEDGILICKGKPLGYLHTDESYQDFELSLEWRWAPGTKPTNSGVLLRIAAEPETFLPKGIEAQLQHQSAGDLYGFYGASIEGDAERFEVIESDRIGTFRAVKKIKGMEKPAGEWNRYDIRVKGGDIELKINGELVNRASGLDVLAGPIGLQTEGSEIHFRNIELTRL